MPTFGHAEIASALIDAKADLNLVNAQQGDTALLIAAFLCHTEVVQALLKAGADKSIRNKAGASAYDTVAGSFEEVKGIYELLDGVLFKPLGKPLDYNRLQATRPKIAVMLQYTGFRIKGRRVKPFSSVQKVCFKVTLVVLKGAFF